MNKRAIVFVNLGVLIATIYWNYYSNTGAINGQTMGSLSDEYANFFTPAGYAFSIWGIIYLSLVGNAIYLLRKSSTLDSQITAKWFSLANIGNCIWVYVWLMEYTGLSVLAMIFILFCLTKNVLDLKIGNQKKPFWIWWPASIYFGWIVVALAANISAFLAKVEWQALFSGELWAAILIAIATTIYLLIMWKKNITYAAYVGVWALVAIMFKQWDSNALVQFSAMVAAIILFGATVVKDYQLRKKGVY